jgi:hypothetical protein
MFSTCTIKRKKIIQQGEYDLMTGKFVWGKKETRTEPHGTPLFLPDEVSTGICSACRAGWEVTGNIFASKKERTRATGKTS